LRKITLISALIQEVVIGLWVDDGGGKAGYCEE
jgi:hypothetical protein